MPKITNLQKCFLTVAMLLSASLFWGLMTTNSVFAQSGIDVRFENQIERLTDGSVHIDIPSQESELEVVVHYYQFKCLADRSWEKIDFQSETIHVPAGQGGYGLTYDVLPSANFVRFILDPDNWISESDEHNNEQTLTIAECGISTPTVISTPEPTVAPSATPTVTATTVSTTTVEVLVLEPQDASNDETVSVLLSHSGTYKWHMWLNGSNFCWGVSAFSGFKLLNCKLAVELPVTSVELHILEDKQEDILLASAVWPLPTPTATATNTPVPATATATNTPVPATATATNTPVPATATATNTPVPATATATNTPVPATATATNTPVQPTETPWATVQTISNTIVINGSEGVIVHVYNWVSDDSGFKSFQLGLTTGSTNIVISPRTGSNLIEIWIDPDNIQNIKQYFVFEVVDGFIQKKVYLPMISNSTVSPVATPEVASEGQ